MLANITVDMPTGFNPLNRGGDIHTNQMKNLWKMMLSSFNPLNRGGDIHTNIGTIQIPPPKVSILLIEAGIFIPTPNEE